MIKKISILAMLGLFCISLAACNTTEGAGQDLENAGESVQDAAS